MLLHGHVFYAREDVVHEGIVFFPEGATVHRRRRLGVVDLGTVPDPMWRVPLLFPS